MPTPISNKIPANGEAFACTLIDGTKISSERCSRWYDFKEQKVIYQVELSDGLQYQGHMNKDGLVELL